MVTLRRCYNLRKRENGKVKTSPRKMTSQVQRYTKQRRTIAKRTPLRRITNNKTQDTSRLSQRQLLVHEHEIERRHRALDCREQVLARMERAIARRERAMRLLEMSLMFVIKTEETTSRPKKTTVKKNATPLNKPMPSIRKDEIEIIQHYNSENPKPVITVDLTARNDAWNNATTSANRHRSDKQHKVAKRRKMKHESKRPLHRLEGREITTNKPAPAQPKLPSDTIFSGQGTGMPWRSSLFPMTSEMQCSFPTTCLYPTAEAHTIGPVGLNNPTDSESTVSHDH